MAKGKTPFVRKLSAATSLKFYKDSLKNAVNKAFSDIKSTLDKADIRSYIDANAITAKLATIKSNTINIIDKPVDTRSFALVKANVDKLISDLSASLDGVNNKINADDLFRQQYEVTPNDLNNMRDLSNNDINQLNNNLNTSLNNFLDASSLIDGSIKPGDIANNAGSFNSGLQAQTSGYLTDLNTRQLNNQAIISNVGNITNNFNTNTFTRLINDGPSVDISSKNNIESTYIRNTQQLTDALSKNADNVGLNTRNSHAGLYDMGTSRSNMDASTRNAWNNAWQNIGPQKPIVNEDITSISDLFKYLKNQFYASLNLKGEVGRTNAAGLLKQNVDVARSSVDTISGGHTNTHQLLSSGQLSSSTVNVLKNNTMELNNMRDANTLSTNTNLNTMLGDVNSRGDLTDLNEIEVANRNNVFATSADGTLKSFQSVGTTHGDIINAQRPYGDSINTSQYGRNVDAGNVYSSNLAAVNSKLNLVTNKGQLGVPSTRSVRQPLATTSLDMKNRMVEQSLQANALKQRASGLDGDGVMHSTLHEATTLQSLENAFVNNRSNSMNDLNNARNANTISTNNNLNTMSSDVSSHGNLTNLEQLEVANRNSAYTSSAGGALKSFQSVGTTHGDIMSAQRPFGDSVHKSQYDTNMDAGNALSSNLAAVNNKLNLTTNKGQLGVPSTRSVRQPLATTSLDMKNRTIEQSLQANALKQRASGLDADSASHAQLHRTNTFKTLENAFVNEFVKYMPTDVRHVSAQKLNSEVGTVRSDVDSRANETSDNLGEAAYHTWTNLSDTSLINNINKAFEIDSKPIDINSKNTSSQFDLNNSLSDMQGKTFDMISGTWKPTVPTIDKVGVDAARGATSKGFTNQRVTDLLKRNREMMAADTANKVNASRASLNSIGTGHVSVHKFGSEGKLDMMLRQRLQVLADLKALEANKISGDMTDLAGDVNTRSAGDGIDGRGDLASKSAVDGKSGWDAFSRSTDALKDADMVVRKSGPSHGYDTARSLSDMQGKTFDMRSGTWKPTVPTIDKVGVDAARGATSKGVTNQRVTDLLKRNRELMAADTANKVNASRASLNSIGTGHVSVHKFGSEGKLDMMLRQRLQVLADLKALEANKIAGDMTDLSKDVNTRSAGDGLDPRGDLASKSAVDGKSGWDAFSRSTDALHDVDVVVRKSGPLHGFEAGRASADVNARNVDSKGKTFQAEAKPEWGVKPESVKTLTDLETLANGRRLEAERTRANGVQSKLKTLDSISLDHFNTRKLESEGRLREAEAGMHSNKMGGDNVAMDGALKKLEDGFGNRLDEVKSVDTVNGTVKSTLRDAEARRLQGEKMGEAEMRNKNAGAEGRYDSRSKDANAEGKRLEGNREKMNREGASRENARDGLERNGEARNKYKDGESRSKLDRESESNRKRENDNEAERRRKQEEEAKRKADEDRRLREEEARQKLNERLNQFIKLLGGVCIFTGSCGGTDLTGGSGGSGGGGDGGSGSSGGTTGGGIGGTGGTDGGTSTTDEKGGQTAVDDTTKRNRMIAIVVIIIILILFVVI
jgi:hypothetical protein